MTSDNDIFPPAEIADGSLSGPEWDAWLLTHPDEASEVALTRRVHELIVAMELHEIEVPAGFEARVLDMVRNDVTLLQLLDLGISGLGRALLEMLNIIFDLLPQPPLQPAAQ